MGLYRGKPYEPKSTLDEGVKGFFRKESTPADKGFEAARHEDESSEEARLARKKKLDEGLAEKVRLQKERDEENKKKKDQELSKAHVDKKFDELARFLGEQQEKLNVLLEKNKEVGGSGEVDEDHDFVESVETENSGGNIMLDVIRFKHSDIVIVVGEIGLTIWESDEDYREWDEKKLLFDLEFEEMEKVDISEIPERKKTGIEKLDALIETYDQINADADGDDHRMPLKAKNYDYYVEELDAHNYDEEQKNLFLGWLSKQK